MGESIQRGVSKIKDFLRVFLNEDVLLALIILFVATASFGLGRLSLTQNTKEPVVISNAREIDLTASVGGAPSVTDSVTEKSTTGIVYVASSQGTRYYRSDCASASRINEENKITFATKEEAELAGYSKALNCPGL